MDTLELIGTILGSNIITNILSSFITWALAKKKYNSEVDANLIQNMQNSLDFYTKLCDDNNARLQEVLQRNEELNTQVLALQSEILEIYKFMGVQTKEELIQLKNSMIPVPKKKDSASK